MSSLERDPVARALAMLQAGQLAQAVPILKTYLASHSDDVNVLHNLGMALSDLGKLEEARRYLLKALALAPQHTNTLVALGVSYERGKDPDAALGYLVRAVDQDPTNPYAHRNLGAVLAKLGRHEEAESHFRAAYELMPSDQMNVHALALGLTELGGEERLQEAKELYKQVIALNPQSQLADVARQARRELAQSNFRRAASGERLDAVMYCVSALEKFEEMSPERVKAIALEIAMLGRGGLDINTPDTRYRLKNMEGDFSGLQLMSLMYVAFKQISPEADIQFDLAKEYESALSLHGRRP